MEKSHFANVVPTLISTPVQMNSNTQLGSIHVLKKRKKIKLNIHSWFSCVSCRKPISLRFFVQFSQRTAKKDVPSCQYNGGTKNQSILVLWRCYFHKVHFTSKTEIQNKADKLRLSFVKLRIFCFSSTPLFEVI